MAPRCGSEPGVPRRRRTHVERRQGIGPVSGKEPTADHAAERPRRWRCRILDCRVGPRDFIFHPDADLRCDLPSQRVLVGEVVVVDTLGHIRAREAGSECVASSAVDGSAACGDLCGGAVERPLPLHPGARRLDAEKRWKPKTSRFTGGKNAAGGLRPDPAASRLRRAQRDGRNPDSGNWSVGSEHAVLLAVTGFRGISYASSSPSPHFRYCRARFPLFGFSSTRWV